MEDSLKIKVTADELDFNKDVNRLVEILVSEKGPIENHQYFLQTFPRYMRQLQHQAQELVDKYSSFLTREEITPFKISLQRMIESGLEKFYKSVSSNKHK